MSTSIVIEGDLAVRKALQDLGEQAVPAIRAALYEEATALLNEADLLVPRDTGTLAGSKFQAEESGVDAKSVAVTVGYGGAAAKYALSVHENPRSGKTGGMSPAVGSVGPQKPRKYKHWAAVGQWKYLETPFKARTAGFLDRIGRSLQRTLLRGR